LDVPSIGSMIHRHGDEASLAYEMLNFLGPDSAEGVAALRERRPPEFRG